MAIQCIEYNASNAAFAMVLNCGVDLLENSLLLKAVKASDVRFLTCILHAGTSANTRLLCGNCLLHLACSAAMVQLLVKWGAGLNAVNAKGETPLHYMCLREHVKEDVLSALLAAGANINAKSHSGQTALHCVLKGELRSLDLVEQLVRAGADVNALDVDGVSPLELAMTLPHFHSLVGSLLLKAGASAKRPMVRCATPFNCGVWYRFDAGFVRELIRAGADVNTVDKNGNTLMHIAIVKNQGERVVFELLQAGANINAANNAGQTPLSLAVSAKKPSQEIIMMLLNSGSTALDHHRGTMVLKVAEWSDEQILVAMIDHCGSNVNIVDENGESALIAAVRMRSAGIVSRLIALGANVNFARTSDGATALHVAINNGHYAMTNMLLRAGADVKAADSSGFTAAHFAVALGDNQLVRHLIKAGANVNSVTSSGDSLLHFAAAATKINTIVCRLVRAGSNIDSVNSRQQTPCHIAVRNVDALCALIDAGAAIDCEDKDGNTPLCNALVAGVRSSVDALVAAGANVRFLHRTGATLLHNFLSNAQAPRPDLVRLLVRLAATSMQWMATVKLRASWR
jgi:ankyrin repeat protein